MKIKLYYLCGIVVCYFAGSCGPGDGSTLNPLGNPLGPPELNVDPSKIDITLEKGSTLTIQIKLKNTGGFPLEIKNITSENDWISLENSSFPISIEAGDSIQISVKIGQSTLPANSFEGSLKFLSNNDDIKDSEFSLMITLEVTEETLAFDPTLTKIQSKIFNFSCTECHGSSNPSEGLNLTLGNSYGNVVDKKSSQVPDLFLVEPFNPGDSYLIRKLEDGPDIVEKRMPLDASPLSQEKIDVVRAWISQGAQDN